MASTTADFTFGAVFVTVILTRGAVPWTVGMIIAGIHLIVLLMEAPSGALGDRYGHRRLLTTVLESAAVVVSRRFIPLVMLSLSLMSATMLLVVARQPMLMAEYGDEDMRLTGLILLLMSLFLTTGAACTQWVQESPSRVGLPGLKGD